MEELCKINTATTTKWLDDFSASKHTPKSNQTDKAKKTKDTNLNVSNLERCAVELQKTSRWFCKNIMKQAWLCQLLCANQNHRQDDQSQISPPELSQYTCMEIFCPVILRIEACFWWRLKARNRQGLVPYKKRPMTSFSLKFYAWLWVPYVYTIPFVLYKGAKVHVHLFGVEGLSASKKSPFRWVIILIISLHSHTKPKFSPRVPLNLRVSPTEISRVCTRRKCSEWFCVCVQL